MQIFVQRPDYLLKEVWLDQNVFIVEKEYKLGFNKFCLIDISLNAEGQDQDKIYIDSPFYRANIRKGNTLVEVIDKKGRKKVLWGRKGTQKIFEIRLEYIERVTRNIQLSKEQKKTFDILFKSINRILESGKRIELLKTEKPNGLNAQVSYFYQLEAWLICSKKVSLMVSSLKDLELYEGKRYIFAKVIARQWFKEIEHLSKQMINKLKKLINGYTLVGEYCGNEQHQGLLLYSQIRIIWFGMIDNYTEQYCIDPFQVRKDIEEFGFKFVKIKRMGSYNDKNKFYLDLEQLHLKISESCMEDQEYGMEGSIIYFLAPQFRNNKPHTKVLCAGKLKTIQYQLFAKIREKLSLYLNRKEFQQQLIKRYQHQSQQLKKTYYSPAPFPQFYYTQILQKGCELVRETKISEQFLRSKFISILKLLLYSINKNLDFGTFGSKLIRNENFLGQLTKIPISAYGSMGCCTKMIYFPIFLPKTVDGQIAVQLEAQLSSLTFKLKTIECQESDNQADRIFTTINNFQTVNQQTSLLSFYLVSGITLDLIPKIISKLKFKGKKNVYHQFILLTDNLGKEVPFQDTNRGQYPFKLSTIMFSYWNTYKEVKNTPTVQQKIEELSKVTEKLKVMRNGLFLKDQCKIKKIQVEMSHEIQLESNKRQELVKIISNILASQKVYDSYCHLILELEKLEHLSLRLLDRQRVFEEVKNLIKSCFSNIQEIDFSIK